MAHLPYRPCVGLMLLNNERKIFCGERHDHKGAWQMPQGGIQDNETAEAAALRELKEEVGITKARIIAKAAQSHCYDFPGHLQQHSVYSQTYRGQEQFWFALQFEGQDSDIDLINHNDEQGPEFSAWEWVGAPTLLERIVPFKRDVYEKVITEFKDLIMP